MPSKQQLSQTKAGFTIIEVVLVLAIAGLIFLMVFVALPALQRSQRDTQRRNDLSRVDTSLVQYQTNHSNLTDNLPGTGNWEGAAEFPANCSNNTACSFIRDYMNTGSSENDGKPNTFQDPDGEFYSMYITANISVSNNQKGKLGGIGTSALQRLDYQPATEGKEEVTGTENWTIKDANNGNAYDAHVIYIVPGGRCYGSELTTSSARHFAVLYRLEGAGTYCIDDQ